MLWGRVERSDVVAGRLVVFTVVEATAAGDVEVAADVVVGISIGSASKYRHTHTHTQLPMPS